MAIEERITLQVDSSGVEGAADAAEHLSDALDEARASAVRAGKAVDDAIKGAKGGAARPSGADLPDLVVPDLVVPHAPVNKTSGAAGDAARAAQDDAASAARAKEKEEAKAAAAIAKLNKKGEAEVKAQTEKRTKNAAKAGQAAAKSSGKASAAVGAFGKAAAAAATVAVAGVAAVASGLNKIGENKIARDNIRAMLNQLTHGRGDEAFKKLDTLARNLGKSTEEVATDFRDFRKKGLDNLNSAALIKLKADLEAVGVQGDDVAKAIDKTANAIMAGGDAGKEIAKTAKEFGAIGDGSNAAAKSVGTVEGAFNSLKRMFDDVLGNLGDEFGPTIVELVGTVKEAFGSIDPATAASAIKNVKAALLGLKPVIKAVASGVEFFMGVFNSVADLIQGKGILFNTLKEIWQDLGTTAADVAGAVSGAWTTLTDAIGSAVDAVTGFVKGLIDSVTGIASSIGGALKSAYNTVKEIVNDIVDAVKEIVDDFIQIGKDIIKALTFGLFSDDEELKTAGAHVGSKVVEGVKSAKGLDEHSPSKKFVEAGEDSIKGLKIGLDTMPDNWVPNAIRDAFPVNDNGKRIVSVSPDDAPMPQAPRVQVTVYVTIQNANQRQTDDILDEVEERIESGVRRALAS